MDICIYHFGWLWMLISIYLIQNSSKLNFYLFIAGASISFVHLHIGVVSAYLDKETFDNHKKQLLIFPLLCVATFFGVSFLLRTLPALLNGLVFFALLWNIYHVHMQKFGILRIYNAKAKNVFNSQQQIPHWVDRLFVFSWIPLYAAYMIPANKNMLENALINSAPMLLQYFYPMVNFLTKAKVLLLTPALGFLIISIGVFIYYEVKVSKFQNKARLSMALGTLLLSASFIFLNPILAYAAFSFGHAVEYILFVYAFQQRKYNSSNYMSIMKKFRLYTKLSFTIFVTVFLLIYCVLIYWRETNYSGLTLGNWLFYWVVFQSLIHFYSDGFLWKMRNKKVRNYL